jgi:hypothetical protein
MCEVDTIILSNTKDIHYYGLLQRTINTLRWSEDTINFNTIIVESNKDYINKGYISNNANNIIVPSCEFNYNKFLNIGLQSCENEWIIIANNDLIFSKKWLTKIFDFRAKNKNFLSFSPYEPNWHCHKSLPVCSFYEGYRTAYEITGWCIVMHHSIINKCQLFDEQFAFWYQDNDYAMSLKTKNIKHALIRDSRVYHETSQSHKLLGEKENELTHMQREIFIKKWPNI